MMIVFSVLLRILKIKKEGKRKEKVIRRIRKEKARGIKFRRK